MTRNIEAARRIRIGPEARGELLAEKVTVSGSVKGILLMPYRPGDETRPSCRVLTWDKSDRIVLPKQMCQQAGLEQGSKVELLFREDGAILLVAARNACSLCGQVSPNMVRLPNGRLVCHRCRRILGCDDDG